MLVYFYCVTSHHLFALKNIVKKMLRSLSNYSEQTPLVVITRLQQYVISFSLVLIFYTLDICGRFLDLFLEED